MRLNMQSKRFSLYSMKYNGLQKKMKQIDVNIKNSPYAVLISDHLKDEIGTLIRDRLGCLGDIVVVTNPTVGALYAEPVLSSLKNAGFSAALAEVPDGEASLV